MPHILPHSGRLADQLIGPSLKPGAADAAARPAGEFGRSIDRPFIEAGGIVVVGVVMARLADQLIGPSLKLPSA